MITDVSALPHESLLERKSRRAGLWLAGTFTVALVLNAVEAWPDPDGAVWSGVRWIAVAAFTVALVWRLVCKL